MTERDSVPRYPIRAVARLTGLGIDTLRAWERRYGAVTPTRDDRGRLYTDADVRRLRLLRDAVSRGHAIGRVALLHPAQLASLASADPGAQAPDRPAGAHIAIDNTPIIDALERFDTIGVDRALGRAALLFTPSEFLQQVIVPVLNGDARSGRGVTAAHERLMSAVIRNVLGSLLRANARPESRVRVLLTTAYGERRELGVLGAALLGASGGLDAIYLGPEVAAVELVRCAVAAECDVVILDVTEAGNPEALQREIEEVAARLPKDVEVWLGGRAAGSIGAAIPPRCLVLPAYEGLESQLARIGALWAGRGRVALQEL